MGIGRPSRWRFLATALALSGLASALGQPPGPATRAAEAPSPFREHFESDATSWRFGQADVQYRTLDHQRARGAGRLGSSCESLSITAGNGSYVHIAHPAGNCRVVSELTIRLWLKATRSDLQVMARVVLPESRDPQTGQPLSALVRGSFYKQVGAWQELRVSNFPQLVERQVRILRSQHGPQVDSRGAYVDLVAINIYGGQGQTQVWIDDLEIDGAVAAGDIAEAAGGANGPSAPLAMAQPTKPVRLSGTILSVNGRPFFPRIIEYQGEPLALLAELGFNGIRVNEPPSRELSTEADEAGLWIVGPPPPLVAHETPEGRWQVEPIDANYHRMLAWSIGQELTARDFENVAETARRLRAADRSHSRPLLFSPETDFLRYSRELRDLLSVYRFPLATSLQLTDYGTWLRERPRLARPGTPVWTVVQTQPAASMRAQWAALGAANAAGGLDADAVRLLAFTAVGAGVRGLEFASHSPLDANDHVSRLRALTLAILNAELDLVEPWAAAGSYLSTADSNDPHVKAVLLQYEASRLLLVTRVGPHAQYFPQHASSTGVSFVVPGIPESHDLIELTAGGVRPLKHKRVTGGTLITLDDFDTTAFVVITPDPLMVGVLSRRLAGIAQRTAAWQRELVARTLAEVETVERRLPPEAREETLSTGLLAAARRNLDEAATTLSAGDRRSAFIAAGRANASLGQLQRKYWERSAASLGSSVASPFVGSFGTLPEHWQLDAAVRASVEEANRLPAGDFEDLQATLNAGWRHLAHPVNGIETSVEISPGGASSGRSCLRIEARASDPKAAQPLVETTPVWITSPPVRLQGGEVVCIRGRVRVAAPVRGSVDGLLIVDSLGGEALAERIGETDGWQGFVMYRAAPRDGEVTLTFALTGFGEALVDDVTIRSIRRSSMAPHAEPATRGALVPGNPTASHRTTPDAQPSTATRPRLDQAQRMRQIFSFERR
jgi:hypothetical protein